MCVYHFVAIRKICKSPHIVVIIRVNILLILLMIGGYKYARTVQVVVVYPLLSLLLLLVLLLLQELQLRTTALPHNHHCFVTPNYPVLLGRHYS